MKNEMKILIVAIIVILIVLVGAFALSGSNNAPPTATPTVKPVTATPTYAPTVVPSAVPTASPSTTAAPTATPTPEPENASGVKLTEFGYWITYPPLGPQTWSTNPPRYFGPENNTVYFDPTSGTYTIGNLAITGQSLNNGPAVVHRFGDLDGTVTITIHMVASLHADGNEYACSLSGSGVSDAGAGNYRVEFSPGENEKTIYVSVTEILNMEPLQPQALTPAPMPVGSVELNITSVDGGYKIGGNRLFTLTADELTVVRFFSEWTYLDYTGSGLSLGPGIQLRGENDEEVSIGIPIQYIGDTGNITQVEVDTSTSSIPASAIQVDPHPTFPDPSDHHNGILIVTIDKAYLYTYDYGNYVRLTIVKTDEYFTSESSSIFKIDINGGSFL